jgi:Cu/Ag efflux pump CusA
MLLAAKAGPSQRAARWRKRAGDAYSVLLARTIRIPRVLLLGTCAVGLLGLTVVPWLREPGPPSFKDRNVLVQWHGTPGTSLPEMDRIATRATHELRALPGVRNAGADVGRAVTGDQIVGTNSAELWVTMDAGADYDRTLDRIRSVANGTPGVDGAVRTYETDRSSRVLTRPPRTVAVRVYGQSYGVLARKAAEVKRAMGRVAGVRDPKVQLVTLQPTMEVEVKLGAALRQGLKPGDVRRAAGTLLQGLTVGDFFEKQKVFEVVVSATPARRPSLDQVRALPIDTPGGHQVPLGSVARVRIHPNPTDIRHDAVSRYVDVRAGVQGRNVVAVRQDVQRRLDNMSFPLEYHAEVIGGSDASTTHSRFVSFVIAAAVGILLLFQAAFRSWRLAFLLLSILPLAAAGGVLVALVAGSQHSLGAYAGLLAIFCIAARHGIMLIARIERLAAEGVEGGAGLAQRAARERLLPTLTSVGATIAALVPFVLLGDVAGNEITHEMAAVIAGGLLTSTVLILLVLPAAYAHVGAGRSRAVRSRDAALPLTSIVAVGMLLFLSGCSDSKIDANARPPAKVVHSGGETRVVLTANAAQRLGIRTSLARKRGHRLAIPYGAVLYEPDGRAITYTSPAPLQYAARRIVVDRISGGSALLVSGPPAGTRVVTVGGDELLGAEQGIEGE